MESIKETKIVLIITLAHSLVASLPMLSKPGSWAILINGGLQLMIILRPEMAVGFPIDLLQSAMSAVPRHAVEWNKSTRGVYESFTIAILRFLFKKSPQESGVFSRTFSQICGGCFNKGTE